MPWGRGISHRICEGSREFSTKFAQHHCGGCVASFDLAQISNRREANKLFPDGYLPAGGRTFSGEDHFDDWRHLDVVAIKCNGARKVGGRALRSRPQEAVPRYSTGKQ
jgi:hypothetical protein